MNIQLVDKMGSDLSVVNAARVSFSKRKELIDQGDEKLIKYLADHDHWSPFGHTTLQFLIKAPIFVARQLVKHQVGLVWNEVSRRYVDDDPEFYSPEIWRFRADNIKQGSDKEGVLDERLDRKIWFVDGVSRAIDQTTSTPKEVYYTCMKTYEALLALNICPEQARMVLPQAMYTSYYVTGSLAAFARAYNLRSEDTAQEEIKELSTEWDKIIGKLFPESWKALTNNNSNNKDEEVIH